ncbi:SprT family zinc-dependent metalloprotease [Arsukibacterium sp.]|uniref:M48 family metallopeptidase n=1 Tax=Arsukibacterium sp. TaxID=1977258 RepID=UPI00299D2DCB|nr:SprT family zinc-dependent metalloprotease [Arsukibacterium sp.]MDX1676868.1 SprT family zinc-dependent metalloprotease [Arsukibacterium sp.]
MIISTANSELTEYQIVYSRRRSLAIIVSQGKVTVRAPIGCSNLQIEQLVTTKQPWIQRHLLRQQALLPTVNWQQEAEILFKGNRHNVVFCRSANSDVFFNDNTLIIAVSHRVDATNLLKWHDKLLNQWLKAQATASFNKRLQVWAAVINVDYRQLNLGQWQRRWGYCDSSGIIGLNWRLIMAPDWVSDYVMVHELVHRQVMDHSPNFWHTVSRYLPDYPQAQAWLRYYQQQLAI